MISESIPSVLVIMQSVHWSLAGHTELGELLKWCFAAVSDGNGLSPLMCGRE